MSAFELQEDILNIHCDRNQSYLPFKLSLNSFHKQDNLLFQIIAVFLTFTFHKVV